MALGNVWALMSKYRFIPDPDCIGGDDLSCLICGNLMIDSFQSGCGCQYCHKCIQGYLGGENKHCPGNKRECKEEYLSLDENVLRNAMLNKKLSKLKVRCPNESCQCLEELSRMEDHLRLCMKEIMDCPYVVLGCDNKGKLKDQISIHLSENTVNHIHLLLDYIQNMKNEVSTLREESRDNTVHMRETENEMKVLKQHSREEYTEVRHLKDDFEESKAQIISVKESKAEKEKIREMENKIDILKQEIRSQKTPSKKYSLSSKIVYGFCIVGLILLPSFIFNGLKEHSEALHITNAWILWKGNVGETFFGVDRFSVRIAQKQSIMSPYFYSHTKGYKLRLLVSPGGDGIGEGTHLSVFIAISKGEYDDQLPWPCKHSIKISIIDQSTHKEHSAHILKYSSAEKDENKKFFDKPIDEYSVPLGNPKFLSLQHIRSKAGLLLNDVVVLKCTVSAPS